MKLKEETRVQEWADSMLEEATDDMSDQDIDITPKNLSEYFEKEYDLPFSEGEAGKWLASRPWWRELSDDREVAATMAARKKGQK